MKVIVWIALLLGGIALGTVAQEETQRPVLVTFEASLTTTDIDKAGRPTGTARRSQAEVRLWLHDRGFTVVRNGKYELYDFNAGRIIRWKSGGKGSTSVSMDSQVDYRRLEHYNRTRIAEVMAASGESQAAFTRYAIETLLGVEGKPGALASRIKRKNETAKGRRTVSFRVDEKEVVQVLEGVHISPTAESSSWLRFVRHRLRIHPIIREDIHGWPMIPERLVIRWVNVGKRFEQTLLRKGLSYDTAVPAPPTASADPGGKPLDRALAAARTANVPSRKILRRQVTMLEKQGEDLAALLSLLEYAIATGDQPAAEIRGLIGRATDQDALRQLVSRLPELNDSVKAREFRAALENLKYREPRHRHLIDIWRANASVTIEEPRVARDLLLAVLIDHPEIAGAWSDLGWIYHQSFKVDDAWRCFEAGLRLAPEHPMLARVVDLRESLRKRYPQFYD